MNEKENVLKLRYRNVYGEKAHEEKYRRDMKELGKRYMLVAAAFLLAITFSVREQTASRANVNYDGGKIVSITRPGSGEDDLSFDMKISASDGKTSVSREKQVRVGPPGSGDAGGERSAVTGEETDEEKLERKIDSAARSAGERTEEKKVILPSVLEDGTRLRWDIAENRDVPMLILGLVIMIIAVKRTRSSAIDRAEKEARMSVSRDMPGFMNKILMLIDGGLVLTEAVARAIRDAEKRGAGEKSYFYRQLIEIKDRSEKSNQKMHEGLADLAQRSGVRELMRFSNLVIDNLEKGADISEKLEAEGRMLWFLRKKKAEEAGRLAETKLSVPLMILIMDLIGVTCAPALLQM